jgi:hypothetical protein
MTQIDDSNCMKCQECKDEYDRHRSQQEIDRVEFIKKLFDKYLDYYPCYKGSIDLNASLLELMVISYFDDIYRFKEYSGSVRADRHKQAAYTIKWISKIKPIQIIPNKIVDKGLILINASFALYVGFSFLDKEISKCISERYIKHLLYSCLYRDVSGRALASTLYVIEQFALKKDSI